MELSIKELKLLSSSSSINMHISQNSIIGISGDDSKYLFSKVIPGLKKQISGSIKIDNMILNPKKASTFRRHIGFLYQNPGNSFVKASVKEEIYYGMHYYKLNWHDLSARTNEVFDNLEIKMDLLNKEIIDLSNTQKKEVMWASIMFYNPEIIIMEDYEIGYTAKEQAKIKLIIKELARKENKIFLIISNNTKYLYDLVDYAYILEKGSIIKEGTKDIYFSDEAKDKVNYPAILSFIDIAKSKNIKLDNTFNINDLIKEMYRRANE